MRGAEASLQVGDYWYNPRLPTPDPTKHRFFGGNHEVYDPEHAHYWKRSPNALDDFGTITLGGVRVFYVRGAWSIDWARRTPGYDWWPDEELSMDEGERALAAYSEERPRIVATHDAPSSVKYLVTRPEIQAVFGYGPEPLESRTNALLQRMLEIHRPERWIFGHYHRRMTAEVDGTLFTCLADVNAPGGIEDAWIDIEC